MEGMECLPSQSRICWCGRGGGTSDGGGGVDDLHIRSHNKKKSLLPRKMCRECR